MLEIVKAGGWLMLPIILCSVVAAAIILERLWTLRRKSVLPEDLTARVWSSLKRASTWTSSTCTGPIFPRTSWI